MFRAHLSAAYPGLPAAADGREVTIAAGGTTGWAVAQWAVASADELAIDTVSYDGLAWTRKGGWTPSGSGGGTVAITLAE
jgi:hypothetical protein